MSERTLLAVADDGTRARIVLPADEDVDELRRRWPPQGLAEVAADAAGPATTPDPSEGTTAREFRLGGTGSAAWDRLESDLGLFAVERIAGRVAVHAGMLVVDGRALLLPGRSHAGKTTLSLALRAAGAALASDEYALVDPTSGRATGWSRPARIRVGTGDSRREAVDPGAGPVPIGMVALLRYDAGLDVAVDVAVPTRADAVVGILDETVCARSRPDEALDAALVISAAPVVRGRRGEADAAAAWLLERLAAAVDA